MGFGAIIVGIIDWIARVQTGRDIYAWIKSKPSSVLSWWASPLILAIGFLILYADKWWMRKHEEKRHEIPSATVTGAQSTSNATGGAGGSSTATGIRELHLHGISALPAVPARVIPHEEKREPHNILLVRPKKVFVEDAMNGSGLYEREYPTGYQAFVACLRNEPTTTSQPSDEKYVTASVVCLDDQNVEIEEGVSGVCWLNRESPIVDFLVGGPTNNAVLAVFSASSNSFRVPFLELKQIRGNRFYAGDSCALSTTPKTIILRLMGAKNQLLAVFKFELLKSGEEWNIKQLPD